VILFPLLRPQAQQEEDSGVEESGDPVIR